jgi:hypothetical protein
MDDCNAMAMAVMIVMMPAMMAPMEDMIAMAMAVMIAMMPAMMAPMIAI